MNSTPKQQADALALKCAAIIGNAVDNYINHQTDCEDSHITAIISRELNLEALMECVAPASYEACAVKPREHHSCRHYPFAEQCKHCRRLSVLSKLDGGAK